MRLLYTIRNMGVFFHKSRITDNQSAEQTGTVGGTNLCVFSGKKIATAFFHQVENLG